MKYIQIACFIAILSLIYGNSCPNLDMSNAKFDPQRFLGKWYTVARSENWKEYDNLNCIESSYFYAGEGIVRSESKMMKDNKFINSYAKCIQNQKIPNLYTVDSLYKGELYIIDTDYD